MIGRCQVKDVLAATEEVFPARFAMEGDNIGLQTGRRNATVDRIVVALDPSPDAVEAAAKFGAQLLVTHHPLWMKPPRRIDPAIPAARGIIAARRSGIAIISAHTNADFAPGGLNDVLADRLGLRRTSPLLVMTGAPIGRVGNYAAGITFRAWLAKVKTECGRELRWCGVEPRAVRRVAICTGSGSDLLALAFEKGADVFVTGDVKYHAARDAEEYGGMRRNGFALVDAGHFGTEKHFVPLASRLLKKTLPGILIRQYRANPPFRRSC